MKRIPKQHLTIEQANKLLPKIRKKLARVMRLNMVLSWLNEMEVMYEDEYENYEYEVLFSRKYFKMQNEFYKHLKTLLETGCVVRDVDIGMVEFYSKHEGKEIVLCWRMGEKEVKYYRTPEEDYFGRKPLKLLEKKNRKN